MDAHADLSLRCPYTSEGTFPDVVVQLIHVTKSCNISDFPRIQVFSLQCDNTKDENFCLQSFKTHLDMFIHKPSED